MKPGLKGALIGGVIGFLYSIFSIYYTLASAFIGYHCPIFIDSLIEFIFYPVISLTCLPILQNSGILGLLSFSFFIIGFFTLIGIIIGKQLKRLTRINITPIIFFVFIILIISPTSTAYQEKQETNISNGERDIFYKERGGEREFIIDAPWQIKKGDFIPLFFEIRDAYGSSFWDYSFYAVEIFDGNNGESLVKRFNCTELGLPIDSGSYCTVNTYTWHSIKYINPNLFVKDENNSIKITAKYDGWGWPDSDAYPDNKPYPLVVRIDSTNLLKFDKWYCGDTHYHSSYTDTKLAGSLKGEFGASLNATMIILYTLGLDWVTVTDHSHSFSRHKNDGFNLSWNDFKIDCNNYTGCLIGTEINCDYNIIGGGNHLLAYNYSNYIEDSFTDIFSPDNPACINIINNVREQRGFSYTAHPELKSDPFGLVHSAWHNYSLPFIGLEIWNGDINNSDNKQALEDGLEKWKDILLGRNGSNSRKIFISAGSDAHGDFQEFGKEYTCVYAPLYSKENIFTGLKNGNSYISNNGALIFSINNSIIGGEINITNGTTIKLDIKYNISSACTAGIYKGVIRTLSETLIANKALLSDSAGNFTISDKPTANSYYRVECLSNDEKNRIYTNPIWVNVQTCQPSWSCNTWSNCLCGSQSRNCVDLNFCGTEIGKPPEIQLCIYNNSFICSNWLQCNNDLQYRTCSELNSCSPSYNETKNCGIDIVYPNNNQIYNTNRLNLHINTTTRLKILEYINYADKNPRWLDLCKNCYGYNKLRSLNQGEQNISVRGSAVDLQSFFDNVNFFIDSIDPRIISTKPANRDFTNGSDFYVTYTEDNLKEAILYYGKDKLTKNNCLSGRSKTCNFDINLTKYNGEEINYNFELRDIANNSKRSRNISVKVDTMLPNITKFNYSINKNYVAFNISINESNFDKILYKEDTRPKTLCSTLLKNRFCLKKIFFRTGQHNITILVSDKAGNSAEKSALFSIP